MKNWIRRFGYLTVAVLLLGACDFTRGNSGGISQLRSLEANRPARPFNVAPPTTAPTAVDPLTQPAPTISWTRIADEPSPGLEATGGALDGKLYVFGGYFNSTYVATNRASVYDPATNAWTVLPTIPRALTHTATVTHGDDFILAGGNSTNSSGVRVEAVDNVYDYNALTQTWTSLPNLPEERAGGGMAIVGDTVHFFSGVNLARVEQGNHWTLDLNNLSAGWQVAAQFPFAPRTHAQTIAIGSDIYVMGGLKGIDQNSSDFADAWKLDTNTGVWTQMANLPIALSHASDATFVYDGRIWLLGGEKAYNVTQKEVFIYNPLTNAWESNTNLPDIRFAGNSAVINNTIYFAMGSTTSTVAWKGTLN